MLRTILTIIQWASAFAIVGLVLLQRGKGADAGAGFGAGASGTVFGARGATTALSRATAVCAAIFMANSLLLAYTGKNAAEAQQKSILDEATAVKRSLPGAGTPPSTPGTAAPAPGTSAPVPGTPAPASGTPAGTAAPTAPSSSAPAPTSSTTPATAPTTAPAPVPSPAPAPAPAPAPK